MDPVVLANPQWVEINRLLFSVWLLLGSVVVFAANMLLGHVMIPSLIASKDLPQIAHKVRPLFYVIAMLAMVVVVYQVYRFCDFVGVLDLIWPVYWI